MVIDGRNVEPTPARFLAALSQRLGVHGVDLEEVITRWPAAAVVFTSPAVVEQGPYELFPHDLARDVVYMEWLRYKARRASRLTNNQTDRERLPRSGL